MIKSTGPLGTNKKIKDFIEDMSQQKNKFHFASNPEFLAQGSAVRDTLYPSRIVIGSSDKYAIEKLKKLYAKFDAEMLITDIKSAEMIKYASNAFLALKISYINDIANTYTKELDNIKIRRNCNEDNSNGNRVCRLGDSSLFCGKGA